MIVTSKFDMDLKLPRVIPEVYVVQDDRYSRQLEVSLYVNGIAFKLTGDSSVMIRYVKPDGKNGVYDTLPDGRKAWEIAGNRVTLALAPQVCTCPGKVSLMATLIRNEQELTTFVIHIQVVARPKGIPDSRNYLNITGFLPQPATAKAGGYLKIAWVDEFGRIAGLDSAEIETLPAVTQEQDGQFLRVVDGKWTAAAIPQGEGEGF